VRSSLPPDSSSVHLFTSYRGGGGRGPAGRYKYFPGGGGPDRAGPGRSGKSFFFITLSYFQMQLPIVLIGLEAVGSREANGSPETIPVTCARARFAGCIFLRHIILALLTERETFRGRPVGDKPLIETGDL
jgi:hypothetical protein